MKLIVGLGNPGPRYAHTRHNMGRLVVEALAHAEGVHFKKEKELDASLAFFEWNGKKIVLAYPELFMNLSGRSLVKLTREFQIEPENDLLVVVDDIDLPLGQLRLRPQGSEGGHKGLKSIGELLGTSHFARLRVGIGRPEAKMGREEKYRAVEDYVLSDFEEEEKALLSKSLALAQEGCRLWGCDSIEKAMNRINATRLEAGFEGKV